MDGVDDDAAPQTEFPADLVSTLTGFHEKEVEAPVGTVGVL
jgi:hypothetical protein